MYAFTIHGAPAQSICETSGERPAISSPNAAQIRTRWAVVNSAIADISAIPKPMQFRMSTFSRLVHGLGQLNSQSCSRNSIAMLLRLQLWQFSWPSPWTNLLKVDILNCMGFGIALMSAMALFTTAQRVRICAALGLLIAGLSPLVSQMDWAGAPWIVKAYIAPDYNSFSFLTRVAQH